MVLALSPVRGGGGGGGGRGASIRVVTGEASAVSHLAAEGRQTDCAALFPRLDWNDSLSKPSEPDRLKSWHPRHGTHGIGHVRSAGAARCEIPEISWNAGMMSLISRSHVIQPRRFPSSFSREFRRALISPGISQSADLAGNFAGR